MDLITLQACVLDFFFFLGLGYINMYTDFQDKQEDININQSFKMHSLFE